MNIIRAKEKSYLISAKDEYYKRYRLKKLLGISDDKELPITEDILLSISNYFFPELKKLFVYLLSICIIAPDEIKKEFKELKNFHNDKLLYRKKYNYINKLFNTNNIFKSFKEKIEKDLCLKDVGNLYFYNFTFIVFAIGKLNSYIYINQKDYYMNLHFIFDYIDEMKNIKRHLCKAEEHLIMQLNVAGLDSYQIVYALPLTDERTIDDVLFIMHEILPKKLEASTFIYALAKYIIEYNYITLYNTDRMSKKERFKFFYDSFYEKFNESDILESLIEDNFGYTFQTQ